MEKLIYRIINGVIIILFLGIGYVFGIGVTEAVLVPYDLTDVADRPQGFSLVSNNFFEAGFGSYLPTILATAVFVTVIYRRRNLLEKGVGSLFLSAALVFIGSIVVVFAYQKVLVPLIVGLA